MFLRLWHLETQSLTMDEVAELRLAATSVPEIVRYGDGFPPLFSLLVHWWMQVPGAEQAPRLFVALIGILGLPLMWLLGRELGGQKLGLLAAFLLAISPIHVWYSQDLRAYGLYFLTVILAGWRYAVARRTEQPRDWLLYALAGAFGLCIHYYFALFIAGLVAIDLLEPGVPGRVRRTVRRHWPVALAGLALLPLLIPDIQAQASFAMLERPLDLSALFYTLFTWLAGFSLGPSLRELHTISSREAIREVLWWAVPIGLAAGYLLLRGLRDPAQRRTWLALALVAGLPLLICAVLGGVLGLSYRPRYVAWGAVPVLLLLATGAMRAGRGGMVAVGMLAAISLVAHVNRHTGERYINEDARGLAREIERQVEPGEPVFVVSGYMGEPLEHYLNPRWPLHPFGLAETTPNPAPALGEMRRAVEPGRRFWLVYSRAFDGDPRGRILDSLSTAAGLRVRSAVPGMELYEGRGW